ncbi:MAG TPA: hypothetical protein VNE67_09075 [Acetobacteraceae bacterium]|nr:hypothetical protein [Acetobacteraceae bacterium]
MDRLIATGSVAAGFADAAPASGTPQFATSGTPGVTAATDFPAYQYNAIQEELLACIAAAGIVFDRTNNTQLLAAIRKLGSPAGLMAQNGWRQNSDGSIDQWGLATILTGTGPITVTLPYTFPNSFWNVVATMQNFQYIVEAAIVNTSSFTLTISGSVGTPAYIFWRALGK